MNPADCPPPIPPRRRRYEVDSVAGTREVHSGSRPLNNQTEMKEMSEGGRVSLLSSLPSRLHSFSGVMEVSARAGMCEVHKRIPARAALITRVIEGWGERCQIWHHSPPQGRPVIRAAARCPVRETDP